MTTNRLHQRLSERWYNVLWLVVGLLLAGGLLFTAKVEADRHNQMEMDSFRAQVADLARISETIIDGRLTQFDNALLVLRDVYVAAPKSFSDIIQLMRSGPRADSDFQVVLVDREGYLIYTDAPNVEPHLYLGERKNFRFFADGGKDSLYIDEPVFCLVTKRYSLTLARPIYDKQGGFLGEIVYSFKQETLADFGSGMQLLGDTTITVVNPEGAVIGRSKDFAKIQGTKLLPELLAPMLKGVNGVFWNRTNADGIERLIAYQHIRNGETPFIVYVETSAVDVLRETSLHHTSLLWSAGFISLGIMALIAMYLKGRKTTIQLIDTLRRSKKQEYEILTGTSLDGFWIADSSDRILDANATVCKMLGYTQEEVFNLNMHEIDASDSPGQITAHVHTVMEVGSDRFESRCRRKDGRIIDVEISAQYVNELGGRLFCFVRDITEQKRVEEALQESEEKYRTVADFTYAMETWRTPDGTFQYVSPSCERITGHTVAEFLADPKLLIKITHPDDQSKVIEHYQLAHQGAGTENRGMDFRILTPGGDIHWIGHSCTAVHSRDGHPLGRRESNRDITKRKQAEDEKDKIKEALKEAHDECEQRVKNRTLELQKSHEQLLHSEKLAAVGKLSASIAHEFNNPLQSVITIIKGIRQYAPLEMEEAELVDLALQECHRMKNLIANLRDFFKPTSDNLSQVDLPAIVKALLLICKKDFHTRNITIVEKYADNIPPVLGVTDQLKQVLLNLFSNAADACEGGGVITITTEKIEENIAIHIEDNGIGISSTNITHIFEPFFTTKPELKGTGLGLSVSYGIIKKHGGHIDVKSESGKGSIFSVFLPIESVNNEQ